VQQINGTGHSIRGFIVTAIAMCVFSVVLWATSTALQSHKARLEKESVENPDASARWPWYDIMIMYGLRYALENPWFRAKKRFVEMKRKLGYKWGGR
jgi:hypothetical protein